MAARAAELGILFKANTGPMMKAKDEVKRGLDEVKSKTQDSAKKSGDALDGLKKKLGGLGGAARKAGMVIAAGLGTGAAAMGALSVKAIMTASDVSESQNKVNVVFGESARIIDEFASKSAISLGMSKGQALEAAGTYGNLLVAMGLTEQAAAGMSTEIVTLAADLGSFNNLETDVALEKLRAGLTGETEPLKSLGINLNQARIEAKALEMGLAEVTYTHSVAEGASEKLAIAQEKHAAVMEKYGAGSLQVRESQLRLEAAQRKAAGSTKKSIAPLDAAAKAQAAWALIQEDSAKAAGDFERTAATSLPNAAKQIKAMADDGIAALGDALLPVAQDVVTMFRDLLPEAISAAEGVIQSTLVPAVEDIRSVFGPAENDVADFTGGLALSATAAGQAGTPLDAYRQSTELLGEATSGADDEVSDFRGLLLDMRQTWEDNEEAIRGAYDKLKTIAKWVKDNKQPIANLIVLLGLLKAGFMIQGAISATTQALTAYKAAMATSTVATGGLRAAIQVLLGSTGIGLLLVLIGTLYLAWTQNWGDIQGKTDKAVKKIRGFLRNLKREWDRLVDKLKNIDLGQIGRDIMEGLRKGIHEKWDEITEWFGDLVTKLPDWVKKLLHIESPSKDFIEIGRSIMEGLALGIQFGGQLADDTMREAIEKLEAQRGRLERLRDDFEAVWREYSPKIGEVENYGDLEERMEAFGRYIENKRRQLTESHQRHMDALDQAMAGSQKGWYQEAIENQKNNAEEAHRSQMDALDEQERRINEVYEMWAAGAEKVEDAHDRAVEAIERAQEGAENYAERVHEAVMARLEEHRAARERFWQEQEDALTRAHDREMAALEAEERKWEDRLTAIKDRLADMKLALDQLRIDLNISEESAKLEALRGLLTGFAQTMENLDVYGGDPRRAREDAMKARRTRASLATTEQMAMLRQALAQGMVGEDDRRTVALLLAGYSQRASEVERIIESIKAQLQGQVDAQQAIIDAKERQITAAERALEIAQQQATIEERAATAVLEGIRAQTDAEKERYDAEIAQIQANRDTELDAIDAAMSAEKTRYEERMEQIAAQYAFELAILDHTQDEIQALVAAARQQAETIAQEAARLYGEAATQAAETTEQAWDKATRTALGGAEKVKQSWEEINRHLSAGIEVPIYITAPGMSGSAGDDALSKARAAWSRAQKYAGRGGFMAAGFQAYLRKYFPDLVGEGKEGTVAGGIFAPLIEAATEAGAGIKAGLVDPVQSGLQLIRTEVQGLAADLQQLDVAVTPFFPLSPAPAPTSGPTITPTGKTVVYNQYGNNVFVADDEDFEGLIGTLGIW